MRQIWLTRDKGPDTVDRMYRGHTSKPRFVETENGGSWRASPAGFGACVECWMAAHLILGRELEPGECVGPLVVRESEVANEQGNKG